MNAYIAQLRQVVILVKASWKRPRAIFRRFDGWGWADIARWMHWLSSSLVKTLSSSQYNGCYFFRVKRKNCGIRRVTRTLHVLLQCHWNLYFAEVGKGLFLTSFLPLANRDYQGYKLSCFLNLSGCLSLLNCCITTKGWSRVSCKGKVEIRSFEEFWKKEDLKIKNFQGH